MKNKITIHARMARVLAGINQRCNNPKSPCYHRYGGRGIKSLISRKDLIYLWNRDKAHLLKRPSVDRIDNDGNYVLSNCRFIELIENTKRNTYTNLNIYCFETGEIFKTYKELSIRFGKCMASVSGFYNRKQGSHFYNNNDKKYYRLIRNKHLTNPKQFSIFLSSSKFHL